MTLTIWIETDCTECCGTGRVEGHDSHGIAEVRCTDCGGRGKHDSILECECCEKPLDALGWCDGCEMFAHGYGREAKAA